MRVLLRHIHYPTRYQRTDDFVINQRYCFALIRQPDLYAWLQREDIVLHGEVVNIGYGSHMLVYGEMDRAQQLYFLLRWGGVIKEDMTG